MEWNPEQQHSALQHSVAGPTCPNYRVTIWARGQGSYIFNSCIEKGISAGVVCMHAAHGEIPSSPQHLKLQEPCPHLNLVTLVELPQL